MSTYQKYADIYKNRKNQRDSSQDQLRFKYPSRERGSSANEVNRANGINNAPVPQSLVQNPTPMPQIELQTLQQEGRTSISPLRKANRADSRSSGGEYGEQKSYAQMAAHQQRPLPLAELKTNEDRTAYMTFLEVQLERVTQTCLGQQETENRVQQILGSQKEMESQVQNLSRVINLLQSYWDAAENDVKGAREQYQWVATKIQEHDQQLVTLQRQNENILRNQIDMGPPPQLAANQNTLTENEETLHNLRAKKNKNKRGASPMSGPHFTNLVSEIDLQMKQLEVRMMQVVNQRDQENKHLVSRIEKMVGDEVKKAGRGGSLVASKRKSTNSKANSSTDMQVIEDTINDWIEKVEAQVNQIEDKVLDRAYKADLEGLEVRMKRFCSEIGERVGGANQAAHGAEKLAARLADDTLQAQQELRQQVQDQEFRISEIYSFMAQGDEESKLFQSGFKQSTNFTPNQTKRQPDMAELQVVEERVTRRIADSVESLGDIIKEYAKKMKSIENRTRDIEKRIGMTAKAKVPVQPTKQSSHAISRVDSGLKKSNASQNHPVLANQKVQKKKKQQTKDLGRNSFENRLYQLESKTETQQMQQIQQQQFMEEQLEEERIQEMDNQGEDDSPRSAFKRARDRSLKELSESFVSVGQPSAQRLSRSRSASPAPMIPQSEPYQNTTASPVRNTFAYVDHMPQHQSSHQNNMLTLGDMSISRDPTNPNIIQNDYQIMTNHAPQEKPQFFYGTTGVKAHTSSKGLLAAEQTNIIVPNSRAPIGRHSNLSQRNQSESRTSKKQVKKTQSKVSLKSNSKKGAKSQTKSQVSRNNSRANSAMGASISQKNRQAKTVVKSQNRDARSLPANQTHQVHPAAHSSSRRDSRNKKNTNNRLNSHNPLKSPILSSESEYQNHNRYKSLDATSEGQRRRMLQKTTTSKSNKSRQKSTIRSYRNRSQSRDLARNQMTSASQKSTKKERKSRSRVQTRKANDRLARLEKMYQQLTEIENDTQI